MSKNKQFAILGLGRFGQSIAKTLVDNGCDVLCVDKNIDAVNEMSKYASNVTRADVADVHAMSALGLNNFDVVIIAIGENMEAGIMATLIAKEMGVQNVITKAKNEIQKSILQKVGADRVVLPEKDMGIRIATSLITSNIIDFISLSDKFTIAEIEPRKEWIDISLKKSNIRAEHRLNVVAIKRNNDIIVSPKAEEIIQKDDILVIIGTITDIQKTK
ncbi:MAG: TrkA family potassium uptake protein [Clostridiales bacterium]|nr:TrkA family potassium uptake protein [Clostridiales bacterium]